MRTFLIVIIGTAVGSCSPTPPPAVAPSIAVTAAPVVYTSGVGVLHVPADLATVTIESTAMVGLRIEIEKRIRQIAERSHLTPTRSLTQFTHELERRKVLNHEAVAGLRDLIALGNQAAHGIEVSPEAAYSAVEYGPRVLSVLDAKLTEAQGAG